MPPVVGCGVLWSGTTGNKSSVFMPNRRHSPQSYPQTSLAHGLLFHVEQFIGEMCFTWNTLLS